MASSANNGMVSLPFHRYIPACMTIAALCIFGAPRSIAQSVLTTHLRKAIRDGEAQSIGQLRANRTMKLDIVLPLRNVSELDNLLSEIYDPNSSEYLHFLTDEEFTKRFGPTRQDYEAVVQFAKRNGFTVIGGSRDGLDVQIQGPVSAVESAFHVAMLKYEDPIKSRIFFSADREPTVNLPVNIWHIAGLNNFARPHPLYVKRSDYAAAHGISPAMAVSHAITGSGPSGSFLGSDMRAAYYSGQSLTGAGQTLGLLEFGGTDLADLSRYFRNAHQWNRVPITLVSTDGTSVSCVNNRAGGYCNDTEQTLDMTQAIGMAPGLSHLVMYVGSLDSAIFSSMTTRKPLPKTIACSWSWTPVDPSTLNPYFKKMAAQGQTFFAASGDNSTWSKTNEAWPADNAYATSVGGTDLITVKAGGTWKYERAWSDSGGGFSPAKIAIPPWQKISGVINASNRGSHTYRNGPDVAANANFSFYTCGNQAACEANDYGGTSFAAPMWAAFIALVNQRRASEGKSTLGSLNPAIYKQNVTSRYGSDFHDIGSGKSGNHYAVKGFDLVTGWGSPKPGLINALAP